MSIEKKIIYKMTLFQLPTEVSKTNVIVFFTEAYGWIYPEPSCLQYASPFCLHEIHFNIILPSTFRNPKRHSLRAV